MNDFWMLILCMFFNTATLCSDKFDQTYERCFTEKSVWIPKWALSDMEGDVGMAMGVVSME